MLDPIPTSDPTADDFPPPPNSDEPDTGQLKTGPDDLAVMKRICTALDKLNPAVRRRVVNYLFDRYVDTQPDVGSFRLPLSSRRDG